MKRLFPFILTLCLIFAGLVPFLDSEARVGGGRSSGRSSSYSPRRSAPSSPSSRPNYDRPAQGFPGQPAPAGGSFLRGMAGGLAGGLLGSMLFGNRSYGGGYGGGGNGGGGMGLMDMVVLAALGFFAYRWFQRRQQTANVGGAFYNNSEQRNTYSTTATPISYGPTPLELENDAASDLFFRIQGAWTRRDLASVRDILNEDMAQVLNKDLEALKSAGKINRLENISVRKVEGGDPWIENGSTYVTFRFTANLLDYTVDEKTQSVLEGSNTTPVKFEEDWTFRKVSENSNWQLTGINQV